MPSLHSTPTLDGRFRSPLPRPPRFWRFFPRGSVRSRLLGCSEILGWSFYRLSLSERNVVQKGRVEFVDPESAATSEDKKGKKSKGLVASVPSSTKSHVKKNSGASIGEVVLPNNDPAKIEAMIFHELRATLRWG
ncbi:uncharacterized protein LOC108954009 [Eucalyptus grandis]|uniref:uncharacterized protein LOC108954009 n=1 Tax=Eucalyptus grandis TaxID=71139 RepID=UPI00192EC4F2|nr:uncharacterized protein LOC108954009 [Eucalyptus grandis]